MRIYRKGNILADVVVKRNSNDCYIVEEIGGEHTVTLGFDILNAVAFEIDDYVVIGGMRYYIRHNEDVTKRETSLGYSYTILFYDESYKLGDWQYFPNGVPERKKNFSTINGTAEFIVDSVLTCANKVDSGWTKGSILVTEPKTYNLQDKTLMEVLTEVANENKTELWIYGKQINIGRREYPSGGLVLFQGEGGGLIDLKLSAVDKTKPTTVIYPYGSDRNLGKDYGNDYLVLPGGQLSIEKNVDRYGRKEVSMQFEDIYPHGIFEVTKKIDNFTLQASGVDFNLTDQLLDGVEVVVTFQTGGLAGYDLNVVDKSWDNSLKQLKLKENKQENALKVPGDINFSVGDKFIITGIKMPQSYIDKAEEELYERAVGWLDENCDKKVQVDAPCDPIEFKNRGITIACGQMVGIYSEKLNIDREIRCTRVKRYLEPDEATTPYRYEITLSDFLKSPSIKDRINDVEKLPEVIKEVDNKARDLVRRTWDDVKELAGELPAMFTEFSESINPVSVNAMQMYLGSEKLQYIFVASKTSEQAVFHDFYYNRDTKVFSTNGGWIRHKTLGIDTLKPHHELGEYKHWLVSSFTSSPLLDGKSRWFYIKASKTSESASFLFSQTKIENTETDYYFVVGFLNSERGGDRGWTTMYGFAEITPGMLLIDRIMGTSGAVDFNLLAEYLILGDSLDYNSRGDKILRIKGAIVQSPSGDEAPLPVMVGAYSSSRQYYAGDEVTCNGSTYRAKVDVKGIAPTNTTYWMVIAQRGNPGSNGPGSRSLYFPTRSTSEAPSTPSGTGSNTPSGWWTYPSYPSESYKYIYVTTSQYDGSSWSSWSTPTIYSQKGIPGALPTTREWVSGTTYVRNDRIVDYIMYKNTSGETSWWRLREGYTSVVAGSIPNTSYFEQISSYDAIAARVLLAEDANLAEFIFKQGRLVSQATTDGIPNTILDGLTGFFQSLNASIRGRMESVDSIGNKIVVDASKKSIQMIDMKGNVFVDLTYNSPSTSNPIEEDLTSRLTMRWIYYGSNGVPSVLKEARFTSEGIEYIVNGIRYYWSLRGGVLLLPTSSANLPSGSIYRDGTYVRIVP